MWPFTRRESRSRVDGYTDSQIASSYDAAAGKNRSAEGLGAVEAAAALVSRCMASGRVEGDPTGAITSDVLELAGRALVECGELPFYPRRLYEADGLRRLDDHRRRRSGVMVFPCNDAWANRDPYSGSRV